MNTSEIINYLNDNGYCFKLPNKVEADWDAVQEHFEKGRMVGVRIDEDKMELRFRVNLGDDFDFTSGEHFSKVYKFNSLDAIAEKLFPNIYDFQTKRFKVYMGDDVIFDGDSTLYDIERMVEPIRMANPDRGVSITYDFSIENGKEINKSFVGHVTWNDQINQFPYYGAYTEEGKKVMDKANEKYKKKYNLA